MGDLAWCLLVDSVIAEFTDNPNRKEEIRALLHEHRRSEVPYAQFIGGASDRRVKDMLTRELLDAGVTHD